MTSPASETILFVGNDETLLAGATIALEALGYTVYSAHDGETALELYEAHRGEIDVIVSDVLMPRMDGRELYHAVRRNDRTTRFVFSTGHGVLAAEIVGGLDSDVSLLAKPWTLGQLTRAIAGAVHTARAAYGEKAVFRKTPTGRNGRAKFVCQGRTEADRGEVRGLTIRPGPRSSGARRRVSK